MPDLAPDALLAAVLDQLACDTLRLVYADWLEEHDNLDRTESIRLQVRGEDGPASGRLAGQWLVRAFAVGNEDIVERLGGDWWRVCPWLAVTRGFVSCVRLADPVIGGWNAQSPVAAADLLTDAAVALLAPRPLELIALDLGTAPT